MSTATRCDSEMEAGVAGKAGIATESSIRTPIRTQTAPSESAGGAADTDAAATSALTILVAEDEPGIRHYVGHVLRADGFHVLQAADGVEALELAAQHSGPIHLLLTDISMPRLDGRELHRRLNHQRPETRTIFMSGSFNTRLHPGSAFLPKPFAPPALVSKISEVLRVNAGSGKQNEPFR